VESGASSGPKPEGNVVRDEADMRGQDETGQGFSNLVQGLHATCNSVEASWQAHGSTRREKVSFGTNMTTDEESSDGCSVDQKLKEPMTAIERFHARKFGGSKESGAGKKVVLKIVGTGSSKKQQTPVKTGMKEALNALIEEEAIGGLANTIDSTTTVKQEGDDAMEALPSNVNPTHLTGTQESRQEK
jgi:hypothetical protein